jgi:predicted nucleotidyltransferase
MRLLDIERKALTHALKGVEGDAYLYGSRVNPLAKGGDIDLLVFSRENSPYRLSRDIAVRFRMECDEKIDVLVINPDRISEEQKPFLKLIQREAVLLR